VRVSQLRDRHYVYDRTATPAGSAAATQEEADQPHAGVVAAIKAALVTSRFSLATANAGFDPYDCRLGRRPGSVWSGRHR